MSTITQIIADAYRKMVNPLQAVARPKWVPASITEESVPAFVQAVTEARKANQSIVKFDGKRYGITEASVYDGRRYAEHENDRLDSIALAKKAKEAGDHAEAARHTATAAEHAKLRDKYTQKETTNAEDDDKSKKIQDMDAENALKQPSDEVPSEVKEEDAEEIKMDNHDEKEKDAEEMQRIAASEAPGDKRAEMAEKLVGNQHKLDVNKNGKIDGEDLKKLRSEELVGNQHKLDVNKNGKIDGEDLKKLRGEEKEEDSEEEHPEPDADNMGGPSDHDADNKGEDEDEDEKPKMTGEQVMASLAATYASMVNEEDEYSGGDNPTDKLHLDVPAFIRVLERAREDFKTDEDIHNFTQQLIAMKSDCIRTADLPSSPVKEGTAADAEAGPEVMDPATQKMKDDADDETELKDGVPGAAQDGGDKVSPADKPAAANSSAALPKVKVITAPVTTNEDVRPIDAVDADHLKALVHAANTASTLAHRLGSKKAHRHAANLHDLVHMHTAASSSDAENKMSHKHLTISKQHNYYANIHENAITNEGMTAIVTRKNSDGSYDEVGMSNKTVVRGSHSNILKKAKEYAKGPHRVELFHGDRIGHGSPHKVIHSE